MKMCGHQFLTPFLLIPSGFFGLAVQQAIAEPSNNNGLTLKNTQNVQPDQMQDIQDIYPPISLPDHFNWPLIITVILALLIAAFIVFFFWRKKKTPIINSLPPHKVALSDLALARQFLVAGQSLIYAERISEILRIYIEKRFNIRSTRQTTAEFLTSLTKDKSRSLIELLPFKDSLKLCLQQCDLAKYAHKTADKDAMETMEASVRKFIEKTMPKEEE